MPLAFKVLFRSVGYAESCRWHSRSYLVSYFMVDYACYASHAVGIQGAYLVSVGYASHAVGIQGLFVQWAILIHAVGIQRAYVVCVGIQRVWLV